MKKILSVLLAVVFLAGCSKKNDVKPLTPQTATVADIAYKWNMQADSTFQVVDGKTQLTHSSAAPNLADGLTTFIQFNTEGTVITTSMNQGLSYTLSNGTIKVSQKNQDGSNGPVLNMSIIAITKQTLLLREYFITTEYDDFYLTR